MIIIGDAAVAPVRRQLRTEQSGTPADATARRLYGVYREVSKDAVPVSYTHLDVYKRQGQDANQDKIFRIQLLFHALPPLYNNMR